MDTLSRPLPRVSVLIRSIDRPTLPRALASVREQTCEQVRTIVVAANGQALTQLAKPCPLVEVIEAAQPLTRSAAANALLDHVPDDLALFLDDDDWLLPDHLARLVDALAAHPQAVAAYAGVQCVSGDREAPTTVHVFDSECSWAEMQLQNRLPIHAVLFRMAAVSDAPPLRFDEKLEFFEDWDFWLRLMARGAFARVPGVSAIYWLDDQAGSGHAAQGSELRQQRLAQFAQRQLTRWTAEDVVRLIDANAERTQNENQTHQTLTQLLADAQARAAAANQALEQAHRREALLDVAHRQALAEVAALQVERLEIQKQFEAQRREADLLASIRIDHLQQFAAIYGSRSWRLTRPLRLASRMAARLRAGSLRVLMDNGLLAFRAGIRRRGWLGLLRRWPHYLRYARSYAAVLSASQPFPEVNPFAEQGRSSHPVRLHPEIAGTAAMIDAKVSVVIPTFNGGEEFAWLLRKLQSQRAVRTIEIVVVDSGSTDGTPDVARSAGVRVIEISQATFSHSHARNLGADNATGDYLIFMVQDAYPIGELWLYGMLRYLLDHREQGIVAASCAEYSRSDSDAMYDSMINTHYRFLGCLEADRIGWHVGDDHMRLRSMGQLSDVSCLIDRELFMRYRFRGDYAEDLDLGIRLIQDGHRLAMLASMKVVHSHNRPAYYYLKRAFVDVVFLVGMFDDFLYPRCKSVAGLLAGVQQVAYRVSDWLLRLAEQPDGEPLADEVARWIVESRQWPIKEASKHFCIDDGRLDTFVRDLVVIAAAPSQAGLSERAAEQEEQQFIDSFIARFDHFNQYAASVYGGGDGRLRNEVADAVRKTFASTLGAALAYLYLEWQHLPDADAEQRQWISGLSAQLRTGI